MSTVLRVGDLKAVLVCISSLPGVVLECRQWDESFGKMMEKEGNSLAMAEVQDGASDNITIQHTQRDGSELVVFLFCFVLEVGCLGSKVKPSL